MDVGNNVGELKSLLDYFRSSLRGFLLGAISLLYRILASDQKLGFMVLSCRSPRNFISFKVTNRSNG